MGIVFYEKEGVFRLDTKNTTYALAILKWLNIPIWPITFTTASTMVRLSF